MYLSIFFKCVLPIIQFSSFLLMNDKIHTCKIWFSEPLNTFPLGEYQVSVWETNILYLKGPRHLYFLWPDQLKASVLHLPCTKSIAFIMSPTLVFSRMELHWVLTILHLCSRFGYSTLPVCLCQVWFFIDKMKSFTCSIIISEYKPFKNTITPRIQIMSIFWDENSYSY